MMTAILPMFKLNGRAALVTGASHGIGLALAEALAGAGADVGLASRSGDLLAANAERIAGETGRRTLPAAAGPARREAMRDSVREVFGHFGRLDTLVNNAGLNLRQSSLEYTKAAWDEVVTLNLRTPFFIAQECAHAMLDSGGSSSINTASLLSLMGRGSVPAYAASRGGIGQFTKALAVEWPEHGIRVNAIAPGFIRPEMTDPLAADPISNGCSAGPR
jgi:2-deoxy-D-gluconate 3-dehydrogenase